MKNVSVWNEISAGYQHLYTLSQRALTGVFRRLSETSPTDICVCSVVKFELRYGALRSDYVEKTLAEQEKFLNRFVSLSFDDQAQWYAAQIRANLARAGTPIGPYDLLIAAITLANGLTLVTHNTGEFGRVVGLQIEDWEI
jgi:tRNA(fMet)-specific endonuclease VapC